VPPGAPTTHPNPSLGFVARGATVVDLCSTVALGLRDRVTLMGGRPRSVKAGRSRVPAPAWRLPAAGAGPAPRPRPRPVPHVHPLERPGLGGLSPSRPVPEVPTLVVWRVLVPTFRRTAGHPPGPRPPSW